MGVGIFPTKGAATALANYVARQYLNERKLRDPHTQACLERDEGGGETQGLGNSVS